MTEDENYYYDNGYNSAIDYVKRQIEVLMLDESMKKHYIPLLLIICAARHNRSDIDRISSKIIEKMEKK